MFILFYAAGIAAMSGAGMATAYRPAVPPILTFLIVPFQ